MAYCNIIITKIMRYFYKRNFLVAADGRNSRLRQALSGKKARENTWQTAWNVI